MISKGQQLTISVAGSADSVWTSPNFWSGTDTDTLRSAVNIALQPYGDVLRHTIQDRGVLDIGTWQYTATLIVAPYSGYATADDFASVVAHVFYEATGYYPSVSVPSVGQPPQPGQTPADIPGLGELGQGITNTVVLLGLILIGVAWAFGKAGGRIV